MTPGRTRSFAAQGATRRQLSQSRRASTQRPASHRRSRTPRGHWFLVGLLMLVFALGLLIEGYAHGILGENSADEPTPSRHAVGAPASITAGGPILQTTGSRVRSYWLPARTVALTFDDGPDPTWNPAVLALLRRYQVPATFFVIGAHAAAYPDFIRAELAAGDEVGSHTYTHTNLATAAGWREGFELALTQNALAGAAAVHTRLLPCRTHRNPTR
jgi:peptidoglycan/xylan/chitin deacetylase (PgdA/CDA1 family)